MFIIVLYFHQIKRIGIMDNLKTLKEQSMNLYLDYRSNLITLTEYLKQIKPLDNAIDKIEMNIFTSSEASCDISKMDTFERP